MKELLTYFKDNEERYEKELAEFIKIPSISADAAHRKDISNAATFVEKQMKAAGLKNVKQHPTKGNPVVYGEWLGAGMRPRY
jgi:acetylornithine deacetylase/succinyl-diaminopimelate desuccinylase-like protein